MEVVWQSTETHKNEIIIWYWYRWRLLKVLIKVIRVFDINIKTESVLNYCSVLKTLKQQ